MVVYDGTTLTQLSSGTLYAILLSAGGSGYVQIYPWTASVAVIVNQVVSSGANSYVYTVAGTTGTTAPTFTSGTASDGSATLSKVAGTGGAITLQTVKEQMLYEVHDPANYLTPDVVVDFTTAKLEQVGPDRVRVSHIGGKQRPATLKVSIGCTEGFIGEDMFFYAGPGALRRAELAKKILIERFRIVGLEADDIRIDYLGLNTIHGAATPANAPEPYEIAVRVAARTKTREQAIKVGREVDGMAVSGIGHTGKRVPHADRTREVIGVWSSLVPREKVPATVRYFES